MCVCVRVFIYKHIIIYLFHLCFRTHKVPKLLVASADGYLYVYSVDLTESGCCALIKQHRFVIFIIFSVLAKTSDYNLLVMLHSKLLKSCKT